MISRNHIPSDLSNTLARLHFPTLTSKQNSTPITIMGRQNTTSDLPKKSKWLIDVRKTTGYINKEKKVRVCEQIKEHQVLVNNITEKHARLSKIRKKQTKYFFSINGFGDIIKHGSQFSI